LKPFKYPHPMIFNLPEKLLTMLDSPVPTLIGINQDISYLSSLEINTENKLIVDLDENDFYFDPKLINEIIDYMPLFYNYRDLLKKEYYILNCRASKHF